MNNLTENQVALINNYVATITMKEIGNMHSSESADLILAGYQVNLNSKSITFVGDAVMNCFIKVVAISRITEDDFEILCPVMRQHSEDQKKAAAKEKAKRTAPKTCKAGTVISRYDRSYTLVEAKIMEGKKGWLCKSYTDNTLEWISQGAITRNINTWNNLVA
jgi:hypothetical protein